ncbi:hypothetical protein [Sorangium sp. So ce381]|uniref:hypothetical protein n=1 Tax=Sorangium sp. So ce381 TaxID=3133307 RepID=UPI003F5B2C75
MVPESNRIDDTTGLYVIQPPEELSLSPAFDDTHPFRKKMSRRIEERKTHFDAWNNVQRKNRETVQGENSEYFSIIGINGATGGAARRG